MKSIKDLQDLFTFFDTSSAQFYDVLSGSNWSVKAFRPFKKDNNVIYAFRLYGEVSGSIFIEYNSGEQWCGGVDYQLHLETNELARFEYVHKLHNVIQKEIDVTLLLKKI